MKKYFLSFIFATLSIAAFGQAGSLSQSVYRSRVLDSTAVTTPTGWGLLYFNTQRTPATWVFSNDNGATWHALGSGGSGGSGTPGGANTQVQYNDSGAFGGEADMTYNEGTNTLTVDNAAVDTEVYDASGWNGDLTVPTKDAVRDKIQSLGSLLTTNVQTGNYTLVLTDADTKIIMLRSVSAQTLTIPPVSSVAFLEGTQITVVQDSTGFATVAAGSGVTIESSAGILSAPCQDCPMVLIKKNATNSWYLWNGSPPLGPVVAYGTYTPTLTNTTNIGASTAYVTGYHQLGTSVTVYGKIDIDPTTAAATASDLGFSLPVASNLTAEQDLGGTATSDVASTTGIRIKGDATNNRAQFVFKAGTTTNDSYNFHFSYQVK